MSSARRWAVVLGIAPLGALVAHAGAYAPHEHHAHPELHHYLGDVATVAVPGSLIAIACLLFAAGRRSSLMPSIRALASAQLALFGVQEVVERLVAHVSLGDLLVHPAIRAGVALQVPVAVVAIAVIRLAHGVVVSTRPSVVPLVFDLPVVGAPRVRPVVRRRGGQLLAVLSRGPPVSSATR